MEQDPIPKEDRDKEEPEEHVREQDHLASACARPAATPSPTGKGPPAVRWSVPNAGPR